MANRTSYAMVMDDIIKRRQFTEIQSPQHTQIFLYPVNYNPLQDEVKLPALAIMF
jgi:hypothetical protein